jgi:hypothetical protein
LANILANIYDDAGILDNIRADVGLRKGRRRDAVISGSGIEEGHLTIAVERVGSETSMARIGRFIDQSLRGKSKTQTRSAALADIRPFFELLGPEGCRAIKALWPWS